MSLAARGITVRFGGVVAVNAMDLDVGPGEIVGLIGPNGAGKTTFVNCVAGIYRPHSGTARWKERDIIGLSPAALLRHGIARTFQSVQALHGLSVLDIVKLGHALTSSAASRAAYMVRSEAELDARLTETLLRPLGLAEAARRPIETLPYGHRKAVDLARALAAEPELLLLDEPVAGLTAQEGLAMAAVIRDMRDRFGCAVVMVEHKMDVVMSTCERIVVMATGARIFEGTPEQVQADRDVRRVYLGEP